MILTTSNNNSRRYVAPCSPTFSKKSSKKDAQQAYTPLGKDFKPRDFDVICARGNQAWNHGGNKVLRALVQKGKQQYGDATTKIQRSMVVTDIVNAIREKGNAFIKLDQKTGQWQDIGDYLSREKVSQLLRNANSSIYKSSTKAKKQRRGEVSKEVYNNVQNVLHSNAEVSSIVKSMGNDARQAGLSDEELMAMFTQSNSAMLSTFKQDLSLVVRFNGASCSYHDDTDDDTASYGGDSVAPMMLE